MSEINIEKRILSTNDWGLMAILHEGLIEKFNQAEKFIEKNEYDELIKNNNSIRDILTELIVIFKNDNIDKEIGQSFREIYLYLNKLITLGENKKDKKYFEDAIKVTNPLLEAFIQKEKEDIGNIVSGLTYGSEDLQDYSRKSNITFEG